MDSIEIRRLEDFKDTNRPSAAAISQCDFSQRVKAAAIIGAANRRPSVSWLVATTCMDLTCARQSTDMARRFAQSSAAQRKSHVARRYARETGNVVPPCSQLQPRNS